MTSQTIVDVVLEHTNGDKISISSKEKSGNIQIIIHLRDEHLTVDLDIKNARKLSRALNKHAKNA